MKTKQQPMPALAKELLVPEIYFKREDTHPYGSHKGRSIPLMMKHYIKTENIRSFCISSSGNAALAAAIAAQKHNQNNPDTQIYLTMFVGNNIEPYKKAKLNSYVDENNIKIEQVEKPKQSAFLLDKAGKAKWLRQSTDDIALRGYAELANELSKIPNLAAVFVPSSSGTTAQGIAEAFLNKDHPTEVHIVQTSSCYPIANSIVGEINIPAEKSLAGAIVDKVAHRKNTVAEAVKKTNGSAWIATNSDIIKALNLIEKTTKLKISANSSLSVAGLMLAKSGGKTWTGPIACLICGD